MVSCGACGLWQEFSDCPRLCCGLHLGQIAAKGVLLFQHFQISIPSETVQELQQPFDVVLCGDLLYHEASRETSWNMHVCLSSNLPIDSRVGVTYGYIGIMENKMETTDNGVFRDYKHNILIIDVSRCGVANCSRNSCKLCRPGNIGRSVLMHLKPFSGNLLLQATRSPAELRVADGQPYFTSSDFLAYAQGPEIIFAGQVRSGRQENQALQGVSVKTAL